jgi:Zn ribbon nucleic-acid-binding protein
VKTVTINEIEYLPCPHCGSLHLTTTDWWDDDGEYDAIECTRCKAAAPEKHWNERVEINGIG